MDNSWKTLGFPATFPLNQPVYRLSCAKISIFRERLRKDLAFLRWKLGDLGISRHNLYIYPLVI